MNLKEVKRWSCKVTHGVLNLFPGMTTIDVVIYTIYSESERQPVSTERFLPQRQLERKWILGHADESQLFWDDANICLSGNCQPQWKDGWEHLGSRAQAQSSKPFFRS